MDRNEITEAEPTFKTSPPQPSQIVIVSPALKVNRQICCRTATSIIRGIRI